MPYQQDLRKAQRQQMLAQMLMQQASPQGAMVGNNYAPPSTFANIANALSKIGGAYAGAKADERIGQLEDERRKAISEQLAQMVGGQSSQTAPSNQSPVMGFRAPPSQAAQPDPALAALSDLPLEQQEQILAKAATNRLFPPEKKQVSPFGKIDPKDYTPESITKFSTSGNVADLVPRSKLEVSGGEAYDPYNLKPGQKVGTPSAGTTVNVNTEKNLYGTMADAQGKANVDLFAQAQKAPELLNRARRVKELVGPDSQAITGAGADWLLSAAKVANQLGFNTGDAAADTEMLARELGGATLDVIKSSGLGAGSGFSNADRDFLEKVAGGQITMQANTLARLAELNERAAMATIQKWNATASRLDPEQLRTLGMAPIEMPAGTPEPAARPKLQKNPDGSYTYSP